MMCQLPPPQSIGCSQKYLKESGYFDKYLLRSISESEKKISQISPAFSEDIGYTHTNIVLLCSIDNYKYKNTVEMYKIRTI